MGQGRSTIREVDVGEFGKHHDALGARNVFFELTQGIAHGNYRHNGHQQPCQGSELVVKVSLCTEISNTNENLCAPFPLSLSCSKLNTSMITCILEDGDQKDTYNLACTSMHLPSLKFK